MDHLTTEKRSWNMSHIRSKDTSIEVKVRKYLFSKGFRYRKNDKRFPGKPDIVMPKYKTVIFINGCFWHGHDGCKFYRIPKSNTEYWSSKILNNKKRDLEHYQDIENSGWSVIVIWECELKNQIFENTMQKIIIKLLENDQNELAK